jgi:GNAT superfamily N-acetyltransferase
MNSLYTEELFVAEQGGMVLGFAAVVTRGPISFLADLFVDPVWQSGGLGRRLLGHVLPSDGRLGCTLLGLRL